MDNIYDPNEICWETKNYNPVTCDCNECDHYDDCYNSEWRQNNG